MKVALVNLGQIVFGSWRERFAHGDTIIADADNSPTVMPEADFERVTKGWKNALQVGTAGELGTTRLCAVASKARVCNLEGGVLERAKPAEIVSLDTPEGDKRPIALTAVKDRDIPAMDAVVTAGIPRLVRNTRATRKTRLTVLRAAQDFFATAR
jgi:hypothetical protein